MRRKSRSTARREAAANRRRTAGLPFSAAMEALEQRSMLAANVLDVTKVLWNGQQVDAVRNEYVLRMPQTNAATAKSPLDYACKTPTVQAGWSVQGLGSGFFKLTAPGVTQATVTSWASRQGAQSVNVNAVRTLALTPNDPLYTDAANWAFPKINASGAWDTGTGTGTTIVGVIDTGVDYNHPDLAANMWKNPNEIAGNNKDDDNNGFIDDIYGIDAIGGTTNPMDDVGHGTMCAGLIGAVGNNAVGIAGVNWSVKIMAIKIFDANSNTSIAAEVRGINYVLGQKIAGQPIAAVNCSYGGYGFVQQEFDALNQLAGAGVTIVAAAGNNSSNNDVLAAYPASFTIPGLISVAASTTADALAGSSNFGAASVDLAAPGVSVLSTRAAQSNPLVYVPYNGNLNYTVNSGTSFASPLVAGAAALLKSIKPAASIEAIKTAILGGVDKVAALNGLVVTGGRLNLKNSVDRILSTTGALPDATFVTGQNLRFLEGNVGYVMAEVRVQLDRPCDPGKSCSVYYTTQPGGSAFPNVDFVATSGYLTFSGSETQKSFYVKLIGDRLAEQAEQFAVQLVAAQSKGVTTGGGAFQQANLVILDDDNTNIPVQPGPTNPGLLPQVRVDVKRDAANTALPIHEGNTATFVVSLDKTSTKPVSVKFRTNQPSLVPVNTALAGVDYLAASGTLTFNPGERTKEFTVSILADSVANEGIDGNNDGDVRDWGEGEELRVVLFEPINADLAPAAGTGGTETVPNTSAAVTAYITDAYVPPAAPGFQITLNYLGNVPTGIRSAAEWAAARWSQVITADLPAVVDPETGTVIDDILIDVQATLLGGTTDGYGGTLANATPEEYRTTGTLLPWKASAGFDPADATNPLLRQIALHEFGHALGFVGDLFAQKRLVNAAGTGLIGANALREYRGIFQVPNALNVPLDTTGGAGTAGSHWNEDVFANELMTGYTMNATSLPLSRITLGAMADLGYTVNYTKADPFTKASAAAAAASAASWMATLPSKTGPGVRLAPVRGGPLNAAGSSKFAALALVAGADRQVTAEAPRSGVRSAVVSKTSSATVRSGVSVLPSGFAALGRG